MTKRVDWFVVVTAVFLAVSCSGGGCGGCTTFEPIPGGFAPAKRNANAGQIRITQTALTKIAADPAALIGPLVGGAMNGVVEFDVPPSCGSTQICCNNGQPTTPCGPILIDLVKRPTDPARLVLAPQANASRLDVTVRARVKTKMDLPITASGLSCDVNIDTTRGSSPDVTITTQISFTQDATAGTTRISAANSTVALQDADIQLSGSFTCTIASFFIGVARGQLEDQVASLLEDQINNATCKSCASGDVAECGSSFATACTDGTCMITNRCLQELGLDGRAKGTNLFGGLSPGTTGALDVYEVAGGYATTNNNGLALGLLGGMQPGGTARDRCGPPGTEPPRMPIPVSSFFQGNTRPDTNAVYDVGIGLHKSQLAELAYGGYDGGLFCLTIGHSTVSQLSTDTFSLISRSLGKLVESNAPMAVGLRPQSAPTIILGRNTFIDDGMGNKTVDEPLLDLTFKGMEIDFFASVDEQYIRVFTVVADVHMPVGLQVTAMGEIAPVIGNPTDAFSNISVKNTEAITESPADLAAVFPQLLQLALPQLSGGISPISLPALGGLALSVTDITAVDNLNFLAIYANLVPAMMPRPVQTTVELLAINEPADAIMHDPTRWRGSRPPQVTLGLGAVNVDPRELEWSYRLDDGTWSAWHDNPRPTLAPTTFWLPGVHKVEVRARIKGHPETIDTEPVKLELPIGTGNPLVASERPGPAPFHGQAGTTGCGCATSTSSDAAPFALVLGLIMLPLRRVRRRARKLARSLWRLGPVVLLAAIASLPGCSCGSNPCGDAECLPGEVQMGAIGRFTSIAGDDQRVLVATYDQVLGDLVIVDATNASALKYTAADGIPAGVQPTHDGGYRGGVEEPGPNVGAWTSIALSNHRGMVSYQDRDANALRFAVESGSSWAAHTVDDGSGADGEATGLYSSLAIVGGRPAIAYMALGLDDGMNHRATELRLARATSESPRGEGDWTKSVIAKAIGSCGGSCAAGQACIAGANAGDPEVCIAPTSDCTSGCASDEVCNMGSCTSKVQPSIGIPGGTGLYVSLVVLPDSRLAAIYYDNVRRALVAQVETAADSSMFTETILDGNRDGADRGMWSSAVVAGDGTIHIAYQDAIGDQLMYTTFANGTAGTPELVDDGIRMGETRTHPVGAAASIYLVSGSPIIAYQDGMTADVYLATKAGTSWTTSALASGPLLEGFSIGATTGHGSPVLAWGVLDPANAPPNGLKVQAP